LFENLVSGIARVVRAPTGRNLTKAAEAITRLTLTLGQRFADHRQASYCTTEPAPRITGSYLSRLPHQVLSASAKKMAMLSAHYVDHRFDLLGSDWVQVKHGMECAGIDGYRYERGTPLTPDPGKPRLEERITSPNIALASRTWSMADLGYVPIDWQLDFKSGYRWSEATWYLDIPWNHVPGADIKVPWELGRMQHLPHLALAFALAVEDGCSARSSAYAREFRNEIIDFVASNPPRFGVNWRCTMEIAIRVVNWLVAYDLFRAYGAQFDPVFEEVFARSVYDHALHIQANLEGSPGKRGNHYLADIAGLLFAAAYLNPSSETERWLNFAIKELGSQIESQFTTDGANFEASTNYHRLASETVVYAAAMANRVSSDPSRSVSVRLARSHFERIERMAEFVIHITKPNGAVVQIGDNDNGRFLKLDPVYSEFDVAEFDQSPEALTNQEGQTLAGEARWSEHHLDHRHLVSAANGLFFRPDFAAFAGDFRIDAEIVRMLCGESADTWTLGNERTPQAATVRVAERTVLQKLARRLEALDGLYRKKHEFEFRGGDLRKGLELCAYPGFGIYIFRSRRLYLAVRCGTIDTRLNAAHAHNDQLLVELNVDGSDVIADPGSYVYSPLPRRRNECRVWKAHFTPRLENEPEGTAAGLFVLSAPPTGTCLYFGEDGFAGERASRSGVTLYRIVRILPNRILIHDACNSAPLARSLSPDELPRFSPGYGTLRA
jgi:hypothetical protein